MKADDLYGLPLEEFTRARDGLAKQLRQAGDRDAADAVKALRKPTVSAWAVNQAVRRRPQDAKALVKAGDELRKAQRGAVGGKDPAALRDATRNHRRLVDDLTETAREALEERGGAGAGLVTRIAQTLRAASIEKEASKSLLAANLAEDVEQVGFGPLLSAVPAATRKGRPAAKPKPKPPPKPKPDPNARKRARLETQLDKARAHVRELEERLEQLSRNS